MKVLVIEDELALLQDIKKYLEGESIVVETASDFRQAMFKISDFDYDCIVVDINLPSGSGFDIVHELKTQKAKAGIIIISARNSLDDKLKGLNIGADDYLVKPFNLSELNARINSINRRRFLDGNNMTTFHEICIDHTAQTVRINDKQVILTHKEFDLLVYFITNKNKVLSQLAIVEHLWADEIEWVDSYAFIYTHIRNLRKKIQDSGCPNYLKSIYGIGYKWEDH
ncbi:MAG: response regulator transcription factor [Bacteroidales bacterium]|nr:response regulator transcription factor [Bacteroidales bacterium]MDD3907252.1 response regulator transcription factor [Bacteroidales bacterium]MDD4712545.1 response regulator transcription factor [Bacteroidales bacterium]